MQENLNPSNEQEVIQFVVIAKRFSDAMQNLEITWFFPFNSFFFHVLTVQPFRKVTRFLAFIPFWFHLFNC